MIRIQSAWIGPQLSNILLNSNPYLRSCSLCVRSGHNLSILRRQLGKWLCLQPLRSLAAMVSPLAGRGRSPVPPQGRRVPVLGLSAGQARCHRAAPSLLWQLAPLPQGPVTSCPVQEVLEAGVARLEDEKGMRMMKAPGEWCGKVALNSREGGRLVPTGRVAGRAGCVSVWVLYTRIWFCVS